MVFEIDDIEYEDLNEYIQEGDLSISIATIFKSEEEFIIGKEHDFQGKYIITAEYPDKTVDYEFVHAYSYETGVDEDDDEEYDILYLLYPSKLPDEKLLNYIDDDNIPMDIKYYPYESENYVTKEDELISFEGIVRKIQKDDNYVLNDDGKNYQILSEITAEDKLVKEVCLHKAYFMSDEFLMQLYKEMEEDNFMGKYKRTYVNNTGRKYEETFTISAVDKEHVFFKYDDVHPYSSTFAPAFVNDENGNLMLCGRLAFDEYIPYSEDEIL